MTEWELQLALTPRWVRDGVFINGERLLVVGWEVMSPSWQMNEASKYWSEPSIDFLAADSTGHLVAIELKRKVPGVRPAWRVLCQVTHRAVCLSRTRTSALLEQIHKICLTSVRSGLGDDEVSTLTDRHQQFFRLERPIHIGDGGIRRVVAAAAFGPSWPNVLAEFNALAWPDVIATLAALGELDKGKSHREPCRFASLEPPDSADLQGVVSALHIPLEPAAEPLGGA
jgi:hypothetical protein